MQRKDTRNNDQVSIRTNRTFKESGNWFFKTREGELAGPFRDELEASTRLEIYIRLIHLGLPTVSGELST
jgi:hypothetical protein